MHIYMYIYIYIYIYARCDFECLVLEMSEDISEITRHLFTLKTSDVSNLRNLQPTLTNLLRNQPNHLTNLLRKYRYIFVKTNLAVTNMILYPTK